MSKIPSVNYKKVINAICLFGKRLSVAGIFTGLVLLTGQSAWGVEAPQQPDKGPGGREYRHQQVIKSVHGKGALEYWIFKPAGPVLASSPVIVFIHGWTAVNPMVYGAWINHIVRRGNIVIYPRWQESNRTPANEFTRNAVEAIKSALDVLRNEGDIKPELDKFAVVGHSAGGVIAPNLVALARSEGLPEPKALMVVQPGGAMNLSKRTRIPSEDLGQIPAGILLLAVSGDEDKIVRKSEAKRIISEALQVPKTNKNYILIYSDDHGDPQLKAGHFSPAAVDVAYDSGERREKKERPLAAKLKSRIKKRFMRNKGISGQERPSKEKMMDLSVNALDYYGYWKLFDGLCDAAFYGKNRQYALGNTPEQRFMGTWSDGTPVKELAVE